MTDELEPPEEKKAPTPVEELGDKLRATHTGRVCIEVMERTQLVADAMRELGIDGLTLEQLEDLGRNLRHA